MAPTDQPHVEAILERLVAFDTVSVFAGSPFLRTSPDSRKLQEWPRLGHASARHFD
jgi:hypothetical protein